MKRLIINVPPRHAKSLLVSVFFPAWVWAQDPDPEGLGHGAAIRPGTWMGPGVRFLFASYNQALSERDNVRSRRIMDSRWFRERWGHRVGFTPDQNTKRRYENTLGGARFASSTGGGVLGDGGDIIVIDDPHNTLEAENDTQREFVQQWWQEVIPTRLNDARTGAFIIIMQRLHAGDLTGHILARETGWDHLCLPARYEDDHPFHARSSIGFRDPRKDGELLWPARFGEAELSELTTKLASYGSAGQLQQRPSPREGGLFKKHWFSVNDVAPAGAIRTVRRWDLAATADTRHDPDWTAGVRMHQMSNGFFVIDDVVRLRGTPAEVERAIRSTAEQDGRGVDVYVPQDPGQAGKAQAAYLIGKLAGWRAKAVIETGSKEVRAGPFAAQCEAGNVQLVRGPWLDDFLTELTAFPNAAHDDQVDAASGAFQALTHPARQGPRSTPSNLW